MQKISQNDILTTNEEASYCCVSSNTILNWIRSGKIPARKDSNRSFKIQTKDLSQVLEKFSRNSNFENRPGFFQYCWEFNSKSGKIQKGCMDCLVHKTRSSRCYEISVPPGTTGHIHLSCKGPCTECDYYHKVQGQNSNVLAVTEKGTLKSFLKNIVERAGYNFRVTDCEYKCCFIIDRFRPDFAIIDCTFGIERSRDFIELLREDSRIPFVKIILVGSSSELPVSLGKTVFAFIEKQFSGRQLIRLLSGS